MKFRLLAMAAMLAAACFGSADSGQQARILKLQKSLLAPCCWAEPVATHNSEVASTMRADIARMVGEGRTDREILDLYKQRYGARVLVEPEGSEFWLMNAVPVVAALGGLGLVVLILRRWLRPIPAS